MAKGEATQLQLDPSVAIAPQITRILRRRVIRNDLRPGDRISESEIARQYGVSRQPVREAFIRLADMGLLSVLPQRGTYVRPINYTAVLDSRFVREAIEADIVKILAEQSDPALIAELRSHIARQKSRDTSDPSSFMSLDDAFHKALADGSGKLTAWKQVEGLKSQMDRVRYLTTTRFPIKTLIQQHQEIVDQIERGSIPNANSAMRIHLREILGTLPHIAAENEAYFELPGEMVRPVNAPIQKGEN